MLLFVHRAAPAGMPKLAQQETIQRTVSRLLGDEVVSVVSRRLFTLVVFGVRRGLFVSFVAGNPGTNCALSTQLPNR